MSEGVKETLDAQWVVGGDDHGWCTCWRSLTP